VTPFYRILADAKDDRDHAAEITERIRDRLVSLTLTDESGLKSDALELILDDRDHAIATPRKGVELRCFLGYRETGVHPMGLYVVDEVDFTGPPARMAIRAKAVALEESETVSGLTDALKEERTRSWHGFTIGDILATIAEAAGYYPKIDAALAQVEIPHIDQTAESDMNFLSRLAVDYDALFKPAGSALLFLPRAATVDGVPRVLIRGPFSQAASNDTAHEWSLNLPERERYARVMATYHDHDAGELVEVVTGGEGPIKILEDPRPDERQAIRAAVAELQRIRRRKGSGSVTVSGNPLLMAEGVVRFEGFRPDFAGDWLVEKAVHTVDEQGYATTIDFRVKGEEGDDA